MTDTYIYPRSMLIFNIINNNSFYESFPSRINLEHASKVHVYYALSQPCPHEQEKRAVGTKYECFKGCLPRIEFSMKSTQGSSDIPSGVFDVSLILSAILYLSWFVV